MTYPEAGVRELLTTRFVPVRIDAEERADLADRFDVEGTPVLVFLDGKGERTDRWAGFLGPEELASRLTLAVTRARLQADALEGLEDELSSILFRHPPGEVAAEALFLLGRVLRAGGDESAARGPWNELLERHPRSRWADEVRRIREGRS